MPPISGSSSASSSAKGGDMFSTVGFDHSGFAVNFGSGVSQGVTAGGGAGAVPWYMWAAGAVVGFALWKKYK